MLGPREVALGDGGLAVLDYDGEVVRLDLYVIEQEGGRDRVRRYASSARSVEQAWRGAARPARRKLDGDQFARYVRATEWGAGLP
jgi:hypothetical protein